MRRLGIILPVSLLALLLGLALGVALSLLLAVRVGAEFMPHLDEGAIWEALIDPQVQMLLKPYVAERLG